VSRYADINHAGYPTCWCKKVTWLVIDSSNPMRCTCPECGEVYTTPTEVALRILWAVLQRSMSAMSLEAYTAGAIADFKAQAEKMR